MTLMDCMNDYHAYLKHEQGVSAQTAEQYISWMRYLHRWLEANGFENPTPDVLTSPTLRRFLYHLSGEKQYRPRTIRGVFSPVKGLAKFLVTNGVLSEDPTRSIQLPKKDAAIRLTISDAEIKALLAACERQRNPKQVALCCAVFQVLIYGALRRGELLDLRLDDVDYEEKSVLVRSGKGSKSRRVFVPKDCTDAVREWLAFRPKNPDGWLFAFDSRRRIHEQGLKTLVDEVCATAGMRDAPNIKPHSIRHWRATDLLKSGADLISIMHFLGHTDLKTTQIYLHSDEERIRSLAGLSTLAPKPETDKVKQERPRMRRLAW